MHTTHSPTESTTRELPRELTTISTDTVRSVVGPTLLERAAMRIGLRLLLWGSHRSAHRADRDAYARHLLREQLRREHDLAVAYAAFSLPPR